MPPLPSWNCSSISVRGSSSPSEARSLLGLAKDERAWHLHERVCMLKKELARRYVAMEVNPIQGITVQLYRVPLQPYVLCSPRSMRQ